MSITTIATLARGWLSGYIIHIPIGIYRCLILDFTNEIFQVSECQEGAFGKRILKNMSRKPSRITLGWGFCSTVCGGKVTENILSPQNIFAVLGDAVLGDHGAP